MFVLKVLFVSVVLLDLFKSALCTVDVFDVIFGDRLAQAGRKRRAHGTLGQAVSFPLLGFLGEAPI